MYALGNRMYGSGDRMYGLGDRMHGLGNRMYGLGYRMYALGNRIYGLGNRMDSLGNRMHGLAFWDTRRILGGLGGSPIRVLKGPCEPSAGPIEKLANLGFWHSGRPGGGFWEASEAPQSGCYRDFVDHPLAL